MRKLLAIDRRIIFALVFISVAGPLLAGISLPITPTNEVKAAYDQFEKLDAGDIVLVSFSYGASTAPEMLPMSRAMLRHAFRRDLKVVAICLWPEAPGLAQQVLEEMTAEFDLEYGGGLRLYGLQAGQFQRHPQYGTGSPQCLPARPMGRGDRRLGFDARFALAARF